jgi:protein TonB
MRRRRRKNPLLARILLVSLAIHVLVLPILAHYGTFKGIQKRFFDTQMVVLAPPKIIPQDEREKPKQLAKKEQERAPKGGAGQKHATPQQHLSNLPPVVASTGGGDGSGPTVDSDAGGKAGVVPTAPKALGQGDAGGTKPTTTSTKTPDKTAEKPKITEVATATTVTKQPAPTTPVVKHTPVYAAAEATYSPSPVIPDDLRYDAVDKTTMVEFVVDTSGTPTDIKVARSCGIEALDKAAVESVKQWKFKPATRDGEPFARTIRLNVEFKVE